MLPGWTAESERRAKEVLYRCMEELQSTKAALYLESGEGSYQLAASYGFGKRDQVATAIASGNPFFDWVRRHRTNPAFCNTLQEAPEFAGILEGAGTARFLTIPLHIGDRLVGFIDARDKARKAMFANEDLPIARHIGAAVEALIKGLGVHGTQPQPKAEPVAPAAVTPAGASPADAAKADVETPAPAAVAPPQRLVEIAPAQLSRASLQDTAGMLKLFARMPGVAVAALTVISDRTARILAVRTIPLDDTLRESVASHQIATFEAAGLSVPPTSTWSWQEENSGGSEKRGEEIRTALLSSARSMPIACSVVTSGNGGGLEILTALTRQFGLTVKLNSYRRAARNLARILLEPGETSYSYLRQHSQAVSELAQRMAVALNLSDEDEELVTLAAYLHDVGMRELEYQRTYRMERPGEMEKKLFQRHPVVGARILESAAFPTDLAGAVRHHHERWDGAGYPDRLAGPAIPRASRIIHVAEVWDVLTSPSSYKRNLSHDAALDLIRAETGRQFDPDLVPVMEQVLRS